MSMWHLDDYQVENIRNVNIRWPLFLNNGDILRLLALSEIFTQIENESSGWSRLYRAVSTDTTWWFDNFPSAQTVTAHRGWPVIRDPNSTEDTPASELERRQRRQSKSRGNRTRGIQSHRWWYYPIKVKVSCHRGCYEIQGRMTT